MENLNFDEFTIDILKTLFIEHNLREERFIVEGFEYITNGYFAIGVKTNDSSEGHEKSKILQDYLKDVNFDDSMYKKVNVIIRDEDFDICEVCNGEGKTQKIKQHCDCDYGVRTFYDDYQNEYECDCLQCDGKLHFYEYHNQKITCTNCNGKGKICRIKNIKLKNSMVDYEYFNFLSLVLEDIKFFTGTIKGNEYPFIFKYGKGILMTKLFVTYNTKDCRTAIFEAQKCVQKN